MSADKLAEVLTDLINEAIEGVDIQAKVEEAASELDFESLVTDHLDLGDLVKEHVDFEDLANDAIACTVEDSVERQVRKLDWGTIIGREVNLTETIRDNVDLTEIANHKMSEMLASRWENSQKILNTYIEERLNVALRDKVEAVVEERLTGSFHDIDRDLNEKLTKAVGPLMDEIAALKAEVNALKAKKSVFRRVAAVFGL
jgi:type III secretory pathway component EscV